MARLSSLPGSTTSFLVPIPPVFSMRPTPRLKLIWSRWGTSRMPSTAPTGKAYQTFKTLRSQDSTRETVTTSRLSGRLPTSTGTLTGNSWSRTPKPYPALRLRFCSICGAPISPPGEAWPPLDRPATCTSATSSTHRSGLSLGRSRTAHFRCFPS